jgi:hypothetical protein
VKNNWKKKLALDAVLTVLYILLMFGYRVGALFHEVAGIGVLLLFGLHIAWNRKSFRGFLKAGMKGTLSLSKALLLASDLILTLALPASVVTGVLVSQIILHTAFSATVYSLHVVSAYATLAIMALHLLLHTKYLLGIAGHWYRENGREGALRLAKRAGAVCAAACVGYVVISTAFSEGDLINNAASDVITDSEASASGSSGASKGRAAGKKFLAAEANTGSGQAITADSRDEDDEQSSTGSTGSDTTADIPTLAEYLSKLYCTACPRHCCLADPQCARGVVQQQQAETDYTEEYLVG